HVRELAARLLDGGVLLARRVVEAAGAGLLAQPVDRVQPQPPHLAALAQAQARGRAVDVVVEQFAGQLAGAHAVVGVLAPAEPAPRSVPPWVGQPLACERQAGGVEGPALPAGPRDVAFPVAGALAAGALDAQDPVDRAGADLVDGDRRRDRAADLRLTHPLCRRQLDRRAVALAALVLVPVLEEGRVVPGDVEVVEAREEVAAAPDDE